MVEFIQLRKEVVKESEKRLKENLLELETEEGLNHSLGYHSKEYKGNSKVKLTRWLSNQSKKALNQQIELIDKVAESKEFGGEFVITIEWRKSRMWGSNPTAYTNYGFQSESIGGCGYCKLSTATAEALNSSLSILKALYTAKEKALKKHPLQSHSDFNREHLGYGTGYSILPSFEGGVGVSSHQRIFEMMGMEMRQVTDTKSTDVFIIKVKK